MSYGGLLKMRCVVRRISSTQVDGLSQTSWITVKERVPCYLDLTYIRMGKDPMWTPEAGRPAERTGVLFLSASVVVKSGDRIEITRGPAGTFTIEGAVDDVWRPTSRHHYELGVREVGSPLANGATPLANSDKVTS